MPTYVRADESVTDLVTEVMQAHHKELAEADVEVSVLMAHGKRDKSGRQVGAAITIGGYVCAGCIRITSLKERALGMADAVMLLDGDRWEDWSRERQAALVDHELMHLRITQRDETDDLGRPKLASRAHDRQFGWFDAVAARHGKNSFEWDQYNEFRATCLADSGRQLWLPFDERKGVASAEQHATSGDPEIDEAMRIVRRASDERGVTVSVSSATVERIRRVAKRAAKK